ncbi:mitochondrial carrier [Auriscalpium vulgare]|uniref:Mitochondrial carrier n=1 Tax=Auriscalpium vulgare TaxID=40419 RepID=A0ACB8R3H6_9AGAM|nr:mitochondrial carrier [Auriscalpium vulgare]
MDPFEAKLVAAAVGSTMTALTMTPFDVVKTRLQTQPPPSVAGMLPPKPLPPTVCCQPANVGCVRGIGNARSMSTLVARALPEEVVCVWDGHAFRTERVNGFYDAVRHVWRAEGLRGLWKGAGTTLMISVPSATAYMLTYDYLLRDVMPHFVSSQALVPLTAGVVARTLVSSVVSPLELIRTNLQSTPLSADQPHTLRSVVASVRVLAQNHGLQQLWRGLGATLWRDVPFSGLYWASYEGLKRRFARQGREGASVAFVCGATSGIGAAFVVSPFDYLKTRRQALVMSGPTGRTVGTLPLLAQVIRTEGAGALFTGLGPRMAKIAPACGIMIACFEGVGGFLTRKGP